MKKILVIAVVVAVLASLVVPASAFAKGSGPQDEGKKYAIVIGISDYPGDLNVLQGGLDLFYADDDAQTVRDTLVGIYGFDPKNVTVLLNSDATRGAIISSINTLKGKVREGSEFFFFFSGHSFRASEIGMPGPADQVGIMVWNGNSPEPVMLWDYELDRAFSGFDGANIVFVFDSCSSASFSELAGDTRILVAATGPTGIAGEFGTAYSDIFPLPPEYEFMADINQGLFTYFFFVQRIQYGYADADSDGIVSIEEAFNFSQPILIGMTQMAGSMGMPLDETPVLMDCIQGDFVP